MTKQVLISIVILIFAMNLFQNNTDRLDAYDTFQSSIYTPIDVETNENLNQIGEDFNLFDTKRAFSFPLTIDSPTLKQSHVEDVVKTEKKLDEEMGTFKINSLNDFYANKAKEVLYTPKQPKEGIVETKLKENKLSNYNSVTPKLAKIDVNGLRALTVENNPKELFEYYRKGLGLQESGNDYKSLNTKTSSGTWGKYQLMGKYVEKDIKRLTSATSMKDFLNKPKEQEKFFEWYYKNNLEPNLRRMKKEGYGKKFSDIELLGMIHFRGPTGARNAIAEGLSKKKESYNPSVSSYLVSLLKYANS